MDTPEEAMKRVALYARTSTDDQTTQPQLHALRKYARRMELKAVEFVDDGQSGAKDRRPALDKLLQAVRRREVDGLAVTKLDRIARSVRHLTELAEELKACGVALVVLDQDINTATPSGRLLFHVLSAISEFERELIRERTRAGLAAARRRGVKLGGRKPVLDRRGRERVLRLRKSGKSLRAIAGLVGVSVGTVHNVVRDAG